MAISDEIVTAIADEMFGLMTEPGEVAPISSRHGAYDLDDAYRVVEVIRTKREARGERVVGRKIGFTNTAAWAGYGISGPIWNYLYDRTTFDLAAVNSCQLGGAPNIRMETEIAFGLGKAPDVGMTHEQLVDCIDWVALDFEVCTSVFPGWRFKVADAAATGVHIALFLGPRRSIAGDRQSWAKELATFSATLSEAGGERASGGGAMVLGSPILAFDRLVKEMARTGGRPLAAGELVTTGTLTEALPAVSGQTWRSEVEGISLDAIEMRLF